MSPKFSKIDISKCVFNKCNLYHRSQLFHYIVKVKLFLKDQGINLNTFSKLFKTRYLKILTSDHKMQGILRKLINVLDHQDQWQMVQRIVEDLLKSYNNRTILCSKWITRGLYNRIIQIVIKCQRKLFKDPTQYDQLHLKTLKMLVRDSGELSPNSNSQSLFILNPNPSITLSINSSNHLSTKVQRIILQVTIIAKWSIR